MQAQAYRSASKQLPGAASSAIHTTGHRVTSGTAAINRHYLKTARNIQMSSSTVVKKPWCLMCGRVSSMLSSGNRLALHNRFMSRSHSIGTRVTRAGYLGFKENVRAYSSSGKNNKYCLKRIVRRHKIGRSETGLNSIKDIVSGANETLQQNATVLRDRALQAIFALNALNNDHGHVIQDKPASATPTTTQHNFNRQMSTASFSDVNKTRPRLKKDASPSSSSKTSIEADADLPTNPKKLMLPLSRMSSEALADIKQNKRWQRLSSAMRRIPSPTWGRVSLNMVPIASCQSGVQSAKTFEDVAAETEVKFVAVGDQTREKTIHQRHNGDSVHRTFATSTTTTTTTTGGFDCDDSVVPDDTKSPTNAGSTTVHALAIKDSPMKAAEEEPETYISRISNLRGKFPPLSMPAISVSDRLSSLSETTSKMRQKVGAVNLPKWRSGASSTGPESPEFYLESPHLFSPTGRHQRSSNKKDGLHGEASQVAGQLLDGAESAIVAERSRVSLLKSKEEKAAEKTKKAKKYVKPVVSQGSIDSRTKTLAMGIKMSQSHPSCLIKLERLNNHLGQYPESVEIATQLKLVPCLLKLRHKSTTDNDLQGQIHKALALLGHADPVKGRGIRVLALDGGGCRGIIAIESLRELERRTNQDIRSMFDYVVGVSSGAVLAYLLSFMNASLDQCEELFRELGREVFERNRMLGTSKLLLNHAYYDTDGWIKILKQHAAGNVRLSDTAMDQNAPKVAAISNKINGTNIKNYVFRNYHLPSGSHSQYQGSVKYQCWEALRASSAAPGYFEEFKLDENVFQDGGVLTNNPSAVGLHECRLLWPNTPIQCVVSLGTGSYTPSDEEYGTEYSSLKKKLVTIMQSATETESVHTILQDLLPSGTYFRFNPPISEDFSLDESQQEKLTHMQVEAQEYLGNNRVKLDEAAKQLGLQKTPIQKGQEWLRMQQLLHT